MLAALCCLIPPPCPCPPATAEPPIAASVYWWLPPEHVCEAAYAACETERAELSRLLWDTGWGCASGDQVTLYGGGWQARRLADRYREARRVQAAWYACWWVTWRGTISDADREEWAERLASMIGEPAFWRGEIPLPIGWR